MQHLSLSIDLGGTNTKIALVDASYKIREKTVFSTTAFSSQRKKLIDEIILQCRSLLKKNSLVSPALAGIGIGVPGLVNGERGVIYYLPNIPHWKHVSIRAILHQAFRCRVAVDNDVRLMALAESRLGAAKGYKNVVCLTLGTGVGGGLILDGTLYRGIRFCAGEIGHMPLSLNGEKCSCGGKGCLERFVGNKYLLAHAKRIFNSKTITLEKVSELARLGNKNALKVYRDFARTIGVALSGVVNLLNPEVIVIGGGLSFAGEFVFSEMRKTIRERAMPIQAKLVKVKRAALGNDAGLIGAALLVRERL